MINLSPAKKLNLISEKISFDTPTSPRFLKKTDSLIKKLINLSLVELRKTMKISDSLTRLNYERYKNFSKNDEKNIKPAIFMFAGDTFNGLSVRSMDIRSFEYAQKNLRILSGLYGILRPFDKIKPYRLEMGTNLSSLIGSDLYKFWKNDICNSLTEDIKESGSKYLFNLSSNEYFKSVEASKLEVEIVNFDFKKNINNELKGIGMMIKRLRGSMAKFIIENKVKNLDVLKDFNYLGFSFKELNKKDNCFLFIN